MRNRVVIYSVAGIVAMSLIATAAFKSRQPASDSVAAVIPVTAPLNSVARHAQAKATHPVAQPAAPAEVNAVSPLPRSYRVLLTNCLFSSRPTTSADKSVAKSDGALTLRGVFQRGRRCVAYIENTASHQYQELNVGDSIGLGKLVAIDLDGVRYAAPGRNMRVEVGQTFSGARKIAAAETSSLSTFRQITE